MIQFIIHPHFSEQIEKLKRKYHKISSDLVYFQDHFSKETGDHLYDSIYKFRLNNSSIPTGKKGGFRIIAVLEGSYVLLISIYSKTEKDSITKTEIDTIINS